MMEEDFKKTSIFYKFEGTIIVLLVLLGCILMYYVESVLQPQYITKSLYKITLFCGTIIFFELIKFAQAYLRKNFTSSQNNPMEEQSPYTINSKENVIQTFFQINDIKKIKRILLLSVGAYLLIIALYIMLARYIDLNNIRYRLEIKEGITKNNSIPIFLYISIINSFLEEVFFRGFAFLQLKKHCNVKVAYFFSAVTFSLYHLAILEGWFNPVLFFVVLVLLTICGLVLNYFDAKYNNLYFSWILHMFSNLSINTIGVFMFI